MHPCVFWNKDDWNAMLFSQGRKILRRNGMLGIMFLAFFVAQSQPGFQNLWCCHVFVEVASRVVVSWTEDLFFLVWMNWGSPDGSPDAMTHFLRTQEVSCQEQIFQVHQENFDVSSYMSCSTTTLSHIGSNYQTSFSGTSAASFKLWSWDRLVAHLGRHDGILKLPHAKSVAPYRPM